MGYQPYVPGGQQAGQVDIGQAFSWTFRKIGQYPVPLLVLALPLVVLGVAQYFVNRAILDAFDDCTTTVFNTESCTRSFGKTIAAAVIVALVFGILHYIVQIGIYRAALKTTRGEAPDVSHLMSGENVGPYILTTIATGFCVVVGLALCFIPGLIAAFFLSFAPMASLDSGMSVGEAFSRSADIAKRNVLPMIILVIVVAVASFIGGLVFGVLWIITMPIQALLLAYVYRSGSGELVAP
jgi:uncharacterized membrane protein